MTVNCQIDLTYNLSFENVVYKNMVGGNRMIGFPLVEADSKLDMSELNLGVRLAHHRSNH